MATLLPTAPNDAADPVVVTRYAATYNVAADGGMRATESLTTKFPGGGSW